MTGQRESIAWRLRVGLLTAVAVFGIWELLGLTGRINPQFFSWPSAILKEGAVQVVGPAYWLNVMTSLTELAVGYAIALVGIPFGLIMGYSKKTQDALEPLVMALYSTPLVALTPLFIIWFGLGIQSKIMLTAVMGFFPILLNSSAGVRSVDPSLILAAKSFGADDAGILRNVVLPASVPFVFTGLRLGLGRALIAVIIGEMLAASAGLGFQMQVSAQYFRTAEYFSTLITIMLIAILGTALLRRLERKWVPWHHA